MIDVPRFLQLRGQLPLVDVRSESEYRAGHIRSAVNIPILNDLERVIVGTTYKKQGQLPAIREGFRLVGPRLIDIITSAQDVGDEFLVHCWRGGMRSSNFCQFVSMAGMKTHQLDGGYKAYRQYAAGAFEKKYSFLVVAGLTGSGKTSILKALQELGEQVVDLEALANHKGSVFGGLGQPPQPTTEQFQNDLFEALHKLDPARRIWIEDESIAVGKIFLPSPFWKTMCESPLVVVSVPREVRLRRLTEEYGNADRAEFAMALQGITKKLGGQHYNAAMKELMSDNMFAAIDIILNYYDKAYANSLARKQDRARLQLSWDGELINNFARHLAEEVEKSEFRSVARSRELKH
jgi:tRNA 2-selenouridine synthase